MPNGSSIISDSESAGHGVLEVQNGTIEGAVLSLYNPATDETVREIYVQAEHSIRMKSIPKGIYELTYTQGSDWDNGEDTFICNAEYSQFERQFSFTEEREQDSVRYSAITVTLHTVVGGNVRTKKISRQEFVKNHPRANLLR
jgi:hypothetical protein